MPALAVFALVPTARATGSGWQRLFDGETLDGWTVVEFAGHGGASVAEDSTLQIERGSTLSGVVYNGPVPAVDFEVTLQARRIAGNDFFCGLTVPVGETHCTLVVGGWGGSVVGVSSIDGMDASENETGFFQEFDAGRWYEIRFRVTASRLVAWLEGRQVIDVDIVDRRVSLRPGEIAKARPFSLTTYATTAQFRDIRLRRLDSGR